MMKRLSMFITALLCCAGSMMAQAPKGTFSITPKVGLNISTLTGDSPIDVAYGVDYISPKSGEIESKARYGFTGGVEIEYQFKEKWAIALEALYGMQGAKFDDVVYGGFDMSDIDMSMKCLNIPVTLKYYVFPGFAVRTGMQLNIISSKMNHDYNQHYIEPGYIAVTYTDTFTPYYKSWNFTNQYISVPIGASYELGHVVFDARYNIGLKNLYDIDNSMSYVDSPSTHCNTFSFTVGYKFPL